jgi:hypothetical protein
VYEGVQVRLQRHPLLTSAILEVNKNKKCGVSRLKEFKIRPSDGFLWTR